MANILLSLPYVYTDYLHCYLQRTVDVIKMTVIEKGQERNLRNYTFPQLEDLQSRLMLVVGKSHSFLEKGLENNSKVDVDRFSMVIVFPDTKK